MRKSTIIALILAAVAVAGYNIYAAQRETARIEAAREAEATEAAAATAAAAALEAQAAEAATTDQSAQTGAETLSPADLFKPENVDLEKIVKLILDSDLGNDTKQGLRIMLESAQENPALFQAALDQVKKDLGL